MKKIEFKRYKIKKKDPWQKRAIEMSKYYGKPVFWVFYKFHPWKIKKVFEELKMKGDKEFSHLMQKLRK